MSVPDRSDAQQGVDVLRVAEKHAPEVVYLVLKEALTERAALADRVAALETRLTRISELTGVYGPEDEVANEIRALAAHAPLSDTTEETA